MELDLEYGTRKLAAMFQHAICQTKIKNQTVYSHSEDRGLFDIEHLSAEIGQLCGARRRYSSTKRFNFNASR
jgi:hypothetical protein